MVTATGIRRPVQIQEFSVAIREASNDELEKIRSEINNAVRHLERSNTRLAAYIKKLKGEEVNNRQELDLDGNFSDDEIDEKDLNVFQESLAENEKVLSNYHERLNAIDQEELHRSSSSNVPETRGSGSAQDKSNAIDSDNTAYEPNSIYL
ncbi:Translation machinery-associated protein 17 [Kluyveromyces marxianus]